MVLATFKAEGKIDDHLCRSCMTYWSNRKNFEVFSAEELLAAITQHIPEKNFQMILKQRFPVTSYHLIQH